MQYDEGRGNERPNINNGGGGGGRERGSKTAHELMRCACSLWYDRYYSKASGCFLTRGVQVFSSHDGTA